MHMNMSILPHRPISAQEVAAGHQVARSLAASGSDLIGLLLRGPSNPAYGLLFSELQAEISRLGLQMITVAPAVTEGANYEQAALNRLLGLRVGGMFVSTGVIRTEMLEPFLDVVIGRPENHPRVYSVSYDEDGNATQLADAVAAQGHRDVAVVSPSVKISVTESRRGQVMALYDAGAITAAMFPTDLRLLAFLSHARAAGIRTPEDLSVTGCDGVLPGIELMGITTLRIPVEQAAVRAAAAMQSMLAAPGQITIEHERLPGTLLPGRTLGPPR